MCLLILPSCLWSCCVYLWTMLNLLVLSDFLWDTLTPGTTMSMFTFSLARHFSSAVHCIELRDDHCFIFSQWKRRKLASYQLLTMIVYSGIIPGSDKSTQTLDRASLVSHDTMVTTWSLGGSVSSQWLSNANTLSWFTQRNLGGGSIAWTH